MFVLRWFCVCSDDLLILKNPSPKVNADGPSTPTCPPTVVLKKKPAPQARPVGDVDNMLTISPKHNQVKCPKDLISFVTSRALV